MCPHISDCRRFTGVESRPAQCGQDGGVRSVPHLAWLEGGRYALQRRCRVVQAPGRGPDPAPLVFERTFDPELVIALCGGNARSRHPQCRVEIVQLSEGLNDYRISRMRAHLRPRRDAGAEGARLLERVGEAIIHQGQGQPGMLERGHRSRVVRGGDLRPDIIEDLPGFSQLAYVRDGISESHFKSHAHRLGQAL